jgi:hypothetical protein
LIKDANGTGGWHIRRWVSGCAFNQERGTYFQRELDGRPMSATFLANGREAWVLVPFVPDWRWMLERVDTDWYTSLRLFRQQGRGDWASVIDEVAVALATRVGGGTAIASRQQQATDKIFSIKVDYDTAILNESLLYELFLQSIPQVGVQLANNWINHNVMHLFNLVSVGLAFVMALLQLSRCVAYAFSSGSDESGKKRSFRDWPMELFCFSLKPANHRALTEDQRAQARAAMPAREPCWPHWYTPPAKEVEGKALDEDQLHNQVKNQFPANPKLKWHK